MKYKSEILEVVHEDATAMFEIGAISTAQMMEFDKMCLLQEPIPAYKAQTPDKIEQIRPATI